MNLKPKSKKPSNSVYSLVHRTNWEPRLIFPALDSIKQNFFPASSALAKGRIGEEIFKGRRDEFAKRLGDVLKPSLV